MVFINPDFAKNGRLLRAAENSPAMRRGENDTEAVRVVQQALIGVGAATMRRSMRPDGSLDGDYGGETVQGVRRFQEIVGLTDRKGRGDGVCGRNTLRELDKRAPYPPVTPGITTGAEVVPRAETSTTTVASGVVRKPSASDLFREYRKFREHKGRPCKATWKVIKNQCAIRMTIALGRCDIGFHLDSKHLKVHSGRKCDVDTPHDASASRVFRHLKTLWIFEHYSKSGANAMTADEIHSKVRGKSGIIYWENCFKSKNPSVGGDHIDFWDGTLMMNDRLNYNGPGESSPDSVNKPGRFFVSMKKQCWFLPLAN